MKATQFVAGYRGELSVENGYGLIKAIDVPQQGQRNAKVTIAAEHLQKPLHGWLDTLDNRDLYVAAMKAYAEGRRCFYTVYVHRKSSVPEVVPYDELSDDQKVRALVEVTLVNGDGVPLDQAPPEPAAEQQTQAHPDEPVPAAEPPARAPRNRGPRIEEARPWQALNSDGSLNIGSYAVSAAQDMVVLAHRLIREQGAVDGEPLTKPDDKRVYGLARRLLTASDTVQATIRADGHADRMDKSHSVARWAVTTALEVVPIPWGAPLERQKEWVDELAEHATEMMKVVLSLVDREVP